MPEHRETRAPGKTGQTAGRKERAADALEILGIRAWAADMGVAPESALAVVASVLTGTGGADAWLEGTWGPSPLPKLDLLSAKSCHPVQRLIDCLVAPLRLMNRRLAQKMGVHSPEAIAFCTAGPFAAGAKHATPALIEKTLRHHWQALTQTRAPGEAGMLHQDLAFDPVPQRLEAITHPDFMVENARGRDLTALVDHGHQHTALVIRPVLALERHCSEPYQVMSQLTALLEGTIVRKRTGAGSQAARAHAILALSAGEIEFMLAHGPGLLSRLLWVVASNPAEARDAEASRRFFSTYRQALEQILDLRREGRTPLIRLQADSMQAFETELGKYRDELDLLPVDPGSSARGLPETLLWALGFLRLALPENRATDTSLVSAAFQSARQLLDSHVREITRKEEARKEVVHCRFAEKIVAEVASRAPLKFRDLARLFKKQRKELFTPVLDVLFETGVLVRDGQERLNPGPVQLADVIEEVVGKLAASQGGEPGSSGMLADDVEAGDEESVEVDDDETAPPEDREAADALNPVDGSEADDGKSGSPEKPEEQDTGLGDGTEEPAG